MNLKKNFIQYVLSNILGMLGLSFYILADTFFIAKGLGADGLTSLNLSISIYSFINAIGLMIGIGAATKYSICQAQKDSKNANGVFTNSIKIGILCGIFFLSVGLFGSSKLSVLLGADQNTFDMTNVYLKTILCFAPFFIMNNIFISFIRNDGNPKLAMAGMLVGSFSNIILDYIFIFPLQMGMFGAAFATGFAPIISMCILSTHFIKKQNRFHFYNVKITGDQVAHICSLGVSSFITEIASGIILIVFNLLILKIAGNTGVAAYGIVANLALVATAIYTGIAQGIQPLLSQSFGEGNTDQIRPLFIYAINTSFGISIVLYILVLMFHNPLVEVFNKDHIELLLVTASEGLRIYFFGFFFAGVNIVTSSLLSSISRLKEAFIISILRSGSMIVPAALLLSNFFGLTGVWLSFPLSEIIILFIGYILIRNSYKNYELKPSV